MKFIETTHKYLDEEDRDYVPVTSFIKSFQAYIDWDTIADTKAKKLGNITKEELLQQWADKRNKGAERGTLFHKMKEDELLSKGDPRIIGYSTDVHAGTKVDSSMLLEDNTTYVEKMIWSKRFGVCGTADLVEVVGGKINIKDYKTNEKLDFESYKHWRDGPKRLLFPVQHLDDCNFNIYQLQVNCYMYMLLQQNRHLKIGDMEVLHIIFDENNVSETRVYPALNLQREVKNMLEQHKTKHK